MFYSELINNALIFSTIAHKNQIRKNPEIEIPYIQHPVMVGFILYKAGFNDDVIAAGILHDVIEDCNVSKKELEKQFGINVSNLVEYVSEKDKTLSWEVRKKKYIERLKIIPNEAKAISAADKIHNIQSIISCINKGTNIWPMFKRGGKAQIKRFKRMVKVLKDIWVHPILKELEEVVSILDNKINT